MSDRPSNLKPCPFCGCDDIEGPFPHSQLRLVWVTRCGNPSCEVEHMADSAEEARARWNRRAPQEATGSDPAALAAKVARTAFCVPGRHTVTITQEGLATIIESALILNGLSHEPAPAEATGLQDKIARAALKEPTT